MSAPRSKRGPRLAPALIGALAAVLAPAWARADLVFEVIVNDPQALNSTTFGAGAPYALDFALTSGGNTNTVTINNFNLGGGSASTATISTFGGASGDINAPTGSVTVTDDFNVNPNAGGFNDFNEQFTPGSGVVTFYVDMTTSYVSGAPDRFTFSILDMNGIPIPTTDPNLGEDALLGVNITGPSIGLSDVETYSAGSGSSLIIVQAVPEPGTLGLTLAGFGSALGWWALRRRAPK